MILWEGLKVTLSVKSIAVGIGGDFNPFTGVGALLRPTGSDLLNTITLFWHALYRNFLYGPYDRVIVVVTAITRLF